jgi:hypothetical protein
MGVMIHHINGVGGGLEPPIPKKTDFLTTSTFAAMPKWHVCGLDYPFTMIHFWTLGVSRLVSTPSILISQKSLARDWLRLLPLAFPEFGRFYSKSFLLGTQNDRQNVL